MKTNAHYLKKCGTRVLSTLIAIMMIMVIMFAMCACDQKTNEVPTVAHTESHNAEETAMDVEEVVDATEIAEIEHGETVETEALPDGEFDEEDFEEGWTQPMEDQEDIVCESELAVPTTSNNSNQFPNAGNSEEYLGRFKINSVGVNVACYASVSQSTVDRGDSAAYFHEPGHAVIADHVNQGFSGIKSCKNGTSAELVTPNGTREYYCVDKIIGYNTSNGLTDMNGNHILDMHPGALVCYTCNSNPGEITIVFFAPKDDYVDAPSDSNNSHNNEYVYGCGEGNHFWGNWEIAWEVMEENGDYYGWNKRICKICEDEDWVQRTEPSPSCKRPVVKEPEKTIEHDKPEVKETEPVIAEPVVVEPEVIETNPAETSQTTETQSVENVEVNELDTVESADNKAEPGADGGDICLNDMAIGIVGDDGGDISLN